jgi:flavin-dependent dehydrogenase
MNKCFEKAFEIISQMVNLEVREAKDFSGIVSFSLRHRLQEGESLYVGEAAGLQDLLWGFGIRYALTSGFLAAKSIAGGDDYQTLIKQRFEHMLRASVVNRFLWERIGWRHYSYLMSQSKRLKDPIDTLYKISNFSRAQRWLFPLARFILSRKYRNLGL